MSKKFVSARMKTVAKTLTASLSAGACDSAEDRRGAPFFEAHSEVQEEDLISHFVEVGFDAEDMEALSDDGVLVQGDMLFRREHLSTHGKSGFRHYRTTNTVRPDVKKIKIRLAVNSCRVPGINDALENAIDAWNSLEGVQFTFSRTSCTTCGPTITIGVAPPKSGQYEGIYGYAEFPDEKGNPGANIKISAWPLDPVTQKVFLMHEIGHAVGLRHTDWVDRASCSTPRPPVMEPVEPEGAEHIPGSPRFDDESLMNACEDDDVPVTQFSDHDKAAIRALYPGPARGHSRE